MRNGGRQGRTTTAGQRHQYELRTPYEWFSASSADRGPRRPYADSLHPPGRAETAGRPHRPSCSRVLRIGVRGRAGAARGPLPQAAPLSYPGAGSIVTSPFRGRGRFRPRRNRAARGRLPVTTEPFAVSSPLPAAVGLRCTPEKRRQPCVPVLVVPLGWLTAHGPGLDVGSEGPAMIGPRQGNPRPHWDPLNTATRKPSPVPPFGFLEGQ